MSRGARNELICPKVVLVMLVLEMPFGFTQFMVFRVSRRNCVLKRSRMWKFFSSEASRLKKPGPRSTPRPALPGRTAPCGTGAKQAVLNQVSAPAASCEALAYCCGWPARGSQIMSGRELAALDPSRPRPAGSTLDVVTVSGTPVYAERMP